MKKNTNYLFGGRVRESSKDCADICIFRGIIMMGGSGNTVVRLVGEYLRKCMNINSITSFYREFADSWLTKNTK